MVASTDDAPTPAPGRPSSRRPFLEEPTEPTGPLPPKLDQQGAEPRTPTGAVPGPDTATTAQQGELLTTSQGARLRDTDHSLKASRRGPVLLQDHHLREKITHFDHERIPERVVHARGAAAHGVFEGYGTAESVCRAGFLAKGKRTEVFTRFSTVVGSRGSMDTARDTRGFATKFYTDEGTFDLVANNIPVFFIQDGIKFPDVVHAAKPRREVGRDASSAIAPAHATPTKGKIMRAVTWQGKRAVSVEDVPDPQIHEPGDAIIRITSTAICGSDLHLYEVLGPYMSAGDVLGHESMGIVEEVGAGVSGVRPGDRVVVPFTISCGECWMCTRGLQSQCETTQVTEQGSGASLFGFSALYGQVPGGQAEYLRVPHADYGLIKVGSGLPDDRYLFLSDILPTAWQGVKYADVPDGGTLAVLGLGPVGQFAARIGAHLGARVLAIDPVPERRAMATRHGIEVFDQGPEGLDAIRDATEGRGPDAVVDAVGMEAHGSPVAGAAHQVLGLLPDAVGQKVMETAGVDRLAALHTSLELVRRGGTVSLSGVYGGATSPMPLLTMFDKQIQLRMGQCNVRHWTDDLLPLVEESRDPLGVTDLVTHRLPLEEAAPAYSMFQKKHDGCIKVVLDPARS